MAKKPEKKDWKVTVRAQLYVARSDSGPNIAGSRLIQGKGCPVTKFHFDDFESAEVAASKLEKYLNAEQHDET